MKGSLVYSLAYVLLRTYSQAFWLSRPPFTLTRNSLQHHQRQRSLLFESISTKTPESSFSTTSSSLGTQEALEFTQQGRDYFQKHFPFPLDDWQCQAGGAILQGRHVICCAPTGAGKTVIGEMALLWNQKGIYTTPLKALSNQKYLELRQVYPNRCGLSTGDVSLSTDADVCVMTTEVYRNRVWRGEEEHPDSTQVVILDEFHYIGNPGRGGVWEECVISCPNTTQLICLSATLSNAASLRAWMESVTARETVLIETKERPVPLQYLFATQDGLYPLFRNAQAGPGARLGLLGYRGDGVSSSTSTNLGKEGGDVAFQTTRGFGMTTSDAPIPVEKLPKGLQVNPALEAAAQRRAQRVQRSLERQKAAWRVQTNQKRNSDSKQNDNSSYSNNGINRKSLSPREERREKERLLKQEMRRAVPSVSALVQRLQQKDLLPAIVFLFSRNGCDQAATSLYQYFKGPRDRLLDINFSAEDDDEDDSIDGNRRSFPTRSRSQKNKIKNQNVLQDKQGRNFRTKSDFLSESMLSDFFDAGIDDSVPYDHESPLSKDNWNYYTSAGLLNEVQVEKVAMRLEIFNTENPEIALDTEICEQFLFGIGSHHAGLLPAQKSLVERLFQDQLLPVVFATETLAAGINMPARTTVLLSMAKRTGAGGSIQLLETGNVLQMAGRAGRRGMDEAGTCVLVATPFESHQQAATILTDPILPIQSQFSPSYTLAIQLIERGQGQLNVAEELIRKSFALWQRRELAEVSSANENNDGISNSSLEAQERFWNDLLLLLEDRSVSSKSIAKVTKSLNDKESLKKTSKSFQGLTQMLELEETTLRYLRNECSDLKEMEDSSRETLLGDFLCDTDADLQHQMDAQQERIQKVQSQLQEHPFTMVTSFVNDVLQESSTWARRLQSSLQQATSNNDGSTLQPSQLCEFAKSAIVAQRQNRKSKQKKLQTKDQPLKDWTVEEERAPDAWDDVLSIIRTLVAYGCLVEESEGKYRVTHGGRTVGRLSLDNSLWALVAMGGAWDVVGASAKLNEYRQAMYEFEKDELYPESIMNDPSLALIPPQEFLPAEDEATKLRQLLLSLPSAELAGYISCLVTERSDREGSGMLEAFHRLSVQQQRVIESSLTVMERFMQVQKDYDVDTNTRNCALDISNCEVVTAWASGCSWQEALRISGQSPGDLARTLSRVLDAVRQMANLPFQAVRSIPTAGMHPDLRHACRKAARDMNRYPVKDPLAFAADGSEDDDTNETGSDQVVMNEDDQEMLELV